MDYGLIGLAFSILGLGLALNPAYHSAFLSWILIGCGLILLLLGSMKRKAEISGHPFIAEPLRSGLLFTLIIATAMTGLTLLWDWGQKMIERMH